MAAKILTSLKGDLQLSEDDLPKLANLLCHVAHKWERIATFLRFDSGTIAMIKSKQTGTDEAVDKLLELLTKWLNRGTPCPTLSALTEALKSKVVEEEKLADQVYSSFMDKSTQRSISYSATQMSVIQADIGRSASLPGSIALAMPEKFESHEEHQPSIKLSLQPSSGPSSAAISSDSDYTFVQQDRNQSNIEDEEVQANIQKFNIHQAHSVDATNNIEKSYTDFEAATSSMKKLVAQDFSKDPVSNPPRIEPCTLLSADANKDSSTSVAAEEPKSSYGCGCGNCSRIDFVSGKCPKPLPSASMFPFLNVQGMSVHETKRLKSKLHRDFQDINEKYADLTADIRKSLENQNITPEELSHVLMDLRVFTHLHDDSQPMFGDRYKELKKVKNIGEIFEILRDYGSFFSHKLIAFIVKKLGTVEDQEKLAQYEQDFHEYCKRHVFECPYFSTTSPKFPDLVMKVDMKVLQNQYTLEAQEEFEDKVVAVLGIANHALKLCSLSDGCLLMTYQIPSAAENAIRSLEQKQIVDLTELGVVCLVCGDTQVFDSRTVTAEYPLESTGKMVNMQSELDFKLSDSIQGDCISYLLEGKCNRKRCNLSHSNSIHGHCAEDFMSISSQVQRIKGHTSGHPEKAFIITESERDPKEVKIIAEDRATLEIAKTVAQNHPGKQQSLVRSSLPIQTGIMGTHRYCYIHPKGIEQPHLFQFKKSDDEYGEKHELQIVAAETLSGNPKSERTYRVEDFLHLNPEEKWYYLLENQERVLSRPLEFSLLLAYKDYVSDIHKKMKDGLNWMQRYNLQPKLEGRFGKLCWRELSDSIPLPDMKGFDVSRFIQMAFETDKKNSRFFYTNISKEGADALEIFCLGRGGILTQIETYDFKIGTQTEGKLDIRVKFNKGVPEAIRVKKAEYKVAIFDILCLHRKNDMRVSLSNYEAATSDHPMVGKFLATLKMENSGIITFAPSSQDREWTVKFVRHKMRTVHSFHPPNYVVSVSTVNECSISQNEDISSLLTLDTGKHKPHIEVELHNLLWEVGFGNQLGLPPEQSLALLIEPDKIPHSVQEQCPEKWSPEWIMESFEKDCFLKMMEDINQIMKAS